MTALTVDDGAADAFQQTFTLRLAITSYLGEVFGGSSHVFFRRLLFGGETRTLRFLFDYSCSSCWRSFHSTTNRTLDRTNRMSHDSVTHYGHHQSTCISGMPFTDTSCCCTACRVSDINLWKRHQYRVNVLFLMFDNIQAADGVPTSTSLPPDIQVHHGATGVLSVGTAALSMKVSWKLLSIVLLSDTSSRTISSVCNSCLITCVLRPGACSTQHAIEHSSEQTT